MTTIAKKVSIFKINYQGKNKRFCLGYLHVCDFGIYNKIEYFLPFYMAEDFSMGKTIQYPTRSVRFYPLSSPFQPKYIKFLKDLFQ